MRAGGAELSDEAYVVADREADQAWSRGVGGHLCLTFHAVHTHRVCSSIGRTGLGGAGWPRLREREAWR